MIFAILYIIFFRANNYYTITIYNGDMIDNIVHYGKKTNIFVKNSNHIEFDNFNHLYKFTKQFRLWCSTLSTICSIIKKHKYVRHTFHKTNCYNQFYDKNYNIGGEIIYCQNPLKSITFKLSKHNNICFTNYYKYIVETNIISKIIYNYYYINDYSNGKYFGLNINAQLSCGMNLPINPYFPGSIYAVRDTKYLANIAKKLNRFVIIVESNYKSFLSLITFDRAIFVLNNLRIDNLSNVLGLVQYKIGGLMFVIIRDEIELDEYNIRKFVNLNYFMKNE
jgi:hypothetical protein